MGRSCSKAKEIDIDDEIRIIREKLQTNSETKLKKLSKVKLLDI